MYWHWSCQINPIAISVTRPRCWGWPAARSVWRLRVRDLGPEAGVRVVCGGQGRAERGCWWWLASLGMTTTLWGWWMSGWGKCEEDHFNYNSLQFCLWKKENIMVKNWDISFMIYLNVPFQISPNTVVIVKLSSLLCSRRTNYYYCVSKLCFTSPNLNDDDTREFLLHLLNFLKNITASPFPSLVRALAPLLIWCWIFTYTFISY